MATINKPPVPVPGSGSKPGKQQPMDVNSKIIHETFECCRNGVCQVHGGLSASPSRSLMNKGPTDSWTSIRNMPMDIAEYAIDKAVFIDLKQDDIKRHSFDEKLDAFQRAAICLKSTETFEKAYVAGKLDVFIRENANRTFTELIPGVIEELKNLNVDFHTSVAASIVGGCRELYVKNSTQIKTLFELVFRYIDAEGEEISKAWTNTIIELMDFLGPNEIEKQFAPVLMAKAKNASQTNGRKAACIILKKMLSKVSPEFGSKQLIPLVGLLCNDPKPSVKGTICLQLPLICPFFKPKESILQYLTALSKDVDVFVKTSLISTIRKIFDMPEMKEIFKDVLQIMKKIVKEAYVANNLQLLQEFSLDMGEIAKTLSEAGVLDGDNKLWFLDAYLQMCRYGLSATERPSKIDLPTGYLNFRANLQYSRRKSLAESLISSGGAPKVNAKPTNANDNDAPQVWMCRVNAAKGFASFVRFAKPLVDFKAGIHPLIVDLIHDPVPLVRAAMAGNVHPVMQLLEPNGHVMCGEFVHALSDDDLSVVEAIVPQISEILKVLVMGKVISPEVMTQALVEVGGAIIFCEERLQGTVNWRMHAKLLEQLSILPYCVPGDYIYANIVPNLFHRLLHLRQMPCRLAAADTIVAFLRHCRRAGQREEIRRKIKETFAQGRSFQDRMLYLFMSKMIMDNFSRKYFREYFFEQTLNMADDPVANVRMKMVGLVPNMQGTLKNAEDDRLLRKLEEVVDRIRNSETDRDVKNALREAVEDMNRMAAKAEKNDRKDKKKGRNREDAEDEAKEKEEAYIASLEPPSTSANPKPIVKELPKPKPVVKPPPPPPPEKKAPPPPPAPAPAPEPPKQLDVKMAPMPGMAAKPQVIQQRTARKGFGSGTKIVEKTTDEQKDGEKNPFLAEAQKLRRKTLVPVQVNPNQSRASRMSRAPLPSKAPLPPAQPPPKK